MDENMKLYYDYATSPLGRLYYLTVWRQLGDLSGKKILDFGSGFGFSAAHFAGQNEVTAVEPDESIIKYAQGQDAYKTVVGDIRALRNMQQGSFDVIICHLVLEYVSEREELLEQFARLLKPDGVLSVVRHNKNGAIIRAVVQQRDYTEAKRLLRGEHSHSSAFGDIVDYQNDELENWCEGKMRISRVFGVRALASLHDDEIQAGENWIEDTLDMEEELLEHKAFVDIAFFNHVLLAK